MAHPLITPTKSPSEEVLAAYNCIEFCFLITDNITVAGSESFLDLQVDNPLVLGNTFIIFGQQFFITVDPNDNGHNIGVGATTTEQRDFIFDTMSTCYEITKQFDVEKVGVENITFTAKKNGQDYNTNFATTNTDLQLLTETAGVDTEVRDAYKVIGCIEIKQNDGSWVVFDEEIRDVVLKLDDDGNLTSEVCFKLHGILRSYFANPKYDLNGIGAFVNEGGVFEFRLSIVDFKSTTGQVGVSGFFDTGDTTYCVLNGMHKLQDNDIKLLPYYDKSLNGFIKSLNQIPLTNYACCDNNGYMALLVLDKERQGWGVQLIGDVFFEGGGSELNYNYGGLSGIGSAVVVIPIGPRQLAICENFLGQGSVSNYTYQGIVFNSATSSIFVDGDNGTFEASIAGISAFVGIVLAQTTNGYIGNGLEVSDLASQAIINKIIFSDTPILFEVGNVYFIDAWVKVIGLDCNCLFNLFLDAELGTFDGANPMDFITVISGATSAIVAGFENNSLKISDLDASTLQHLSTLMIGTTPIQLQLNTSYELSAWVKVTGVDCNDCGVLNLFFDANDGTFDGPSPLNGIVEIAGSTAATDIGVVGDGLQLSTLHLATISDGSELMRGDTGIQFYAGVTYTVTMFVRIDYFNCDLLSNLFLDGANGTFEGALPLAGILALAGITSSIDVGVAAGDGLQLTTLDLAIISNGANLMYGNTGIDFLAGEIYIVTMFVRVEDFNCLLLNNLFVDGENGTFDGGIPLAGIVALVGITTAIDVGSSGDGLQLTTLDSATIVSGSELMRGDSDIDFLTGVTYTVTMLVRVEDFNCLLLNNIFLDGDGGTFEGGTPLAGIVALAGITTGIGSGTGSGDGLQLATLDLATIVSGSELMRGDSDIDFLAGVIYTVTMFLRVENFNCNLIGNLFVDGDSGSFESPPQLAGIVSVAGSTIAIDAGIGGSDGLMLSTLDLAAIPTGTELFRGDTNINFLAGETYTVYMQLMISDLDCNLIGNLFEDGDKGRFDANVTAMSTPIINLNLNHAIGGGRIGGNAIVVDNVVPLILGTGSQLLKGDTNIAFEAGKTYEISGWVDLEGDALINACLDPTGLEIGVAITGALGIGDVTFVSKTNAVYNSTTCGGNPTWVKVTYTFISNINMNNTVGFTIAAGSSFLQPIGQEIGFDDLMVIDINLTQEVKFHAGLTVPIGANGTEVIDTELVFDTTCSNLDQWIQVQTTLTVTNNFAGKIGLFTTGSPSALEDTDVRIRIDDVIVVPSSVTNIDLYAGLTVPIGANGTEVIDSVLLLEPTCSNLGAWIQVQTTLNVTNNFTGKIGLFTTGQSNLLQDANVVIRVDDILIVPPAPFTIELYAGLTVPIGANGTEVVDSTLLLEETCSNLGAWIQVQTTLTVTNAFTGKIGLFTTGKSELLENSDIIIRVDTILVTPPSPFTIQFNAGLTVPIGANGTEIIDSFLLLEETCSNLDQWIQVQTTLNVTNNFTGNIGLITTGKTKLLQNSDTIIRVDSIIVSPPLPQEVKFHAGLTAPIGANGTEVIDIDLAIQDPCLNLGTWVQVKTTLNVTGDFIGKVGLITTEASELLSNSDVRIRVDSIEVLSSFEGVVLRMDANPLFLGGTKSFDNVITLGADCSQLDKWIELKTTLTTSGLGGTILAATGLQVFGNAGCLKMAGVNVFIDNIVLKKVESDGIEFSITTTDGADILTVANIGDCDSIGEWMRISSSYTPVVNTNETIEILATGLVNCLKNVGAKVFIDEIAVRCHSIDAAAITELQTVIIEGDCDGCQDDCCCNSEFFYRNELGQFDFIHLECIKEEVLNISKIETEVCQDCEDDISTAGSKTTSAKSKTGFSINTRITKETVEQYKVFLASIEIYHIVDNECYPVVVLNGDLAIKQKVKVFIDVDLEFEYKFENPTLIA